MGLCHQHDYDFLRRGEKLIENDKATRKLFLFVFVFFQRKNQLIVFLVVLYMIWHVCLSGEDGGYEDVARGSLSDSDEDALGEEGH